MTAPRPLQSELLADASKRLEALSAGGRESGCHPHIDVLEAVASCLGGFSLRQYRRAFPRQRSISASRAREEGEAILDLLQRTRVPPSLLLSALAEPELEDSEKRRKGVFYTDFRLASYLADLVARNARKAPSIIDPACGTGVLLVAATLSVCGPDRKRRGRLLAECVHGADLSTEALESARLALSSLTDDLGAIRALNGHLLQQDSLWQVKTAWNGDPDGFDVVVGNPPWEKLKLSRHEFLLAQGIERHYGADYRQPLEKRDLDTARNTLKAYLAGLADRFQLQGTGEPDLYKLFVELSLQLAKPGGQIALLVPGGLIRSQGTSALRRFLLSESAELEVTVFENRARFFPIDSRFKFLCLHASRKDGIPRQPIHLLHADSRGEAVPFPVVVQSKARIGRRSLEEVRPDLSIPEVRTSREWRLFLKMCRHGEMFGDLLARHSGRIVREIDMTRDRGLFRRQRDPKGLPLIEGRMVHQFHFGAKAYISGSGRRAMWAPLPLNDSNLHPQFWISRSDLRPDVDTLVNQKRLGFCDVTGQTNERSLLAALVPAGVVCGNKVPTISVEMPRPERDAILHLWLSVFNSLPFDWLLRRVVTTSVNYFLLYGLPFPTLLPQGLPARRLIWLAKDIERLQRARKPDLWQLGLRRAEIDVRVAEAYGLGFGSLSLLLKDFPLLDRGQEPLPGEQRSTVTRDLVLYESAKRYQGHSCPTSTDLRRRLTYAQSRGAVPYVPTEFTEVALASAAKPNKSYTDGGDYDA